MMNTPFFYSPSLEELAQQQGVEPVSDLNEISDLWPVDDDPDEMLNFFTSEKQMRQVSSHFSFDRLSKVSFGSFSHSSSSTKEAT